MIALATPVLSQGSLTADQFVAAVIDKPHRTRYSDVEVRHIAERTIHWCRVFGVNHDIVFAQIAHETDWLRFTGDVQFGQHNFAGLGATGGVPGHSFPLENGLIQDDGIDAGVLAVVAHHAVYRWGERANWPADLRVYAGDHADPRYSAVLSTGNAGKMIVLGDYRGTWAVPGRTYPESLMSRAAQIAAYPKGNEMSLTDLIRDRITARGVEVHDLRGQLATRGTPETRPHAAWRYTGVHHTAVNRGVRDLAGDVASWKGHATFHVMTRGWPTIAYFIGISLSGRVFILRDVEVVGYHAFAGANYQTLAVCGDLTDSNTPTAAMLRSLDAVLRVLHEETPELSNLLGAKGTYGHRELTFLDAQNQTGCPGALLPWVREYRNRPAANDDPNARYFEETGHWVINQGTVKMLDLWRELGGMSEPDPVGFPLSGMTLDEDGVYRQLFENRLLEWRAHSGGRSGGLGQRYARLLEQVGEVKLAVADDVPERAA